MAELPAENNDKTTKLAQAGGRELSGAQKDGYDKDLFCSVFQKDCTPDLKFVPPLTIDGMRPFVGAEFERANQPDNRSYNQRLVEKENGTLRIEVNFKGATNSPYVGTGFPVNRDGSTLRTPDGTQYIATADHVIHDRQKDLYSIVNEQFDKMLATKPGGVTPNGRITKEDLVQRRGQAAFEAAAEGKNVDSMIYQFDYAIKNFNQISGTTRPGATIGRSDLQNFYDRNTEITVVTRRGERFKSSLAASDAANDLAVLKVGCLTPIQQHSFAPNFQVARSDPRPGQQMRTLGFNAAGQFTVHEGAVVGKGQGLSNDSQNFYALTTPIDGGNSGGPALDKRTLQVVGINHASDNREATVASPRKLLDLLAKLPREATDPNCYTLGPRRR